MPGAVSRVAKLAEGRLGSVWDALRGRSASGVEAVVFSLHNPFVYFQSKRRRPKFEGLERGFVLRSALSKIVGAIDISILYCTHGR